MMDFLQWFLIFAIVFISFTLLMLQFTYQLSVIPWCASEAKDTQYYTASWTLMAIPEHDSFTVTLPPLPPYFFESKINYDDFSETIRTI